jgi:hypothetical protein
LRSLDGRRGRGRRQRRGIRRPIAENRKLYATSDGDPLPRHWALLGSSGLGDATRLIAQGVKAPEDEVADSFVTLCTAPQRHRRTGCSPQGRIPARVSAPFGRYLEQAFGPHELRQMGPTPAVHDPQPGVWTSGCSPAPLSPWPQLSVAIASNESFSGWTKRQMFGRAGFELLRKRVLLA